MVDRRDRNVRPDLYYDEVRRRQEKIEPGTFPGSDVPTAFRQQSTGPVIRFANVPFSFGTSSKQIAPGRPNRRYLLIQNKSASTIYVAFGQDADSVVGLTINANGFYEPYLAPSDAVFIIGSAAGTGLLIEGIIT